MELALGLSLPSRSGTKFVYSGPIAGAPAASGYPAGAMVYDNTTGKSWKVVGSIWVLTDYDYPAFEQLAVTVRNYNMLCSCLGQITMPLLGGVTYDTDPSRLTQTVVSATSRNAYGCAYRPITNKLYIATDAGVIYKVNSDGSQTSLGGTARLWRGIAFNVDGSVLFGLVSNGSIYRIDPDTGVQTDLVVTARPWVGAFVHPTTGYLYASATAAAIYKIDPSTGAQVAVTTGTRTWRGLTFNPDNGKAYGAVMTDAIYSIDLESGAQVSTGITALSWYGVSFNHSNRMLYATIANTAIYQLNPAKLPA